MNTNTTKNVTTSLEWLQETVEAATKSKVSQQTQMINDINFMWMMSNVNIYEKAVLTQLILKPNTPCTVKELSFWSGITESSCKRAVNSLKKSNAIINHPKVKGVILNPKTLG